MRTKVFARYWQVALKFGRRHDIIPDAPHMGHNSVGCVVFISFAFSWFRDIRYGRFTPLGELPNEFPWYFIFAGGKIWLVLGQFFVSEIRWRLHIHDAETSSNFRQIRQTDKPDKPQISSPRTHHLRIAKECLTTLSAFLIWVFACL